MNTLKPIGGVKSGSISEITSIIVNGSTIVLYGENSSLFVLKEKDLENAKERSLLPSDTYEFDYSTMLPGESSSIISLSPSP